MQTVICNQYSGRSVQQFVAYYRVSTDRQGASGLGLDAQREAVTRFMAGKGELTAQFVEVESGRKENRPQLRAALAECRKRRAILVIAKLDRLARNVHFISGADEQRGRIRGRGHAEREPTHHPHTGGSGRA